METNAGYWKIGPLHQAEDPTAEACGAGADGASGSFSAASGAADEGDGFACATGSDGSDCMLSSGGPSQ